MKHFLKISRNSEAFPSELLENLEEILKVLYYMHSDMLESSTTQRCATLSWKGWNAHYLGVIQSGEHMLVLPTRYIPDTGILCVSPNVCTSHEILTLLWLVTHYSMVEELAEDVMHIVQIKQPYSTDKTTI